MNPSNKKPTESLNRMSYEEREKMYAEKRALAVEKALKTEKLRYPNRK